MLAAVSVSAAEPVGQEAVAVNGAPRVPAIRPVAVAGDVVVLRGQVTLMLAELLGESDIERFIRRRRLGPVRRDALLAAYLALEQAGDEWRAAISASGNSETAAGSGGVASETWIDVKAAALLLGRSERQVRNLADAGDLEARRPGREWQLLRSSVIAWRDRRAA